MLGLKPSEEAVCNDVNNKPCAGDGLTNGMVRLFGQVNVGNRLGQGVEMVTKRCVG